MLLLIEELRELLESPVIHKGKNNSLDFKCKCPECGKPEFFVSINKNNHPAQCWRKDKCGYSTNIYGLLKLLKKTHLIKRNQVKDLITLNNTLIKNNEPEIDIVTNNISLPIGYKRSFENLYLKSRGFESTTYNRYEVGVSNIAPKIKNDYIIFPVREFEETKGYVARCQMSKEEIDFHNSQFTKKILRYRNSSSEFGKLLYGIEDIVEVDCVIVVEGIFDKIAIDHYLRYYELTEIVACVCSFGSSITIEQITKITLFGVSKIILFYDEDAIDKIKHLNNKISVCFKNVNIEATVPTSDKDPADSTFEEIEIALLQSKPLNFFHIEKIKNKLK